MSNKLKPRQPNVREALKRVALRLLTAIQATDSAFDILRKTAKQANMSPEKFVTRYLGAFLRELHHLKTNPTLCSDMVMQELLESQGVWKVERREWVKEAKKRSRRQKRK